MPASFEYGPTTHAGWNGVQADTTPSNEFIIAADLWVPGARSALPSFRAKTNALKKRGDKDKDDPPRKLKERTSWLGGAPRAGGHWRAVTCTLVEEDEFATLHVRAEDAVLYSILIHTLHATEIRLADRSLFNRPDVLALFCKAGSGPAPAPGTPLYLAFPAQDALHGWTALLRSYAAPEVYGRRIAPDAGGLYRMWRRVELSVLQGRALGTARLVADGGGGADMPSPTDDAGGADLELFCEVVLGGEPAARTTLKPGAEPYWHESFAFTDLPPLGALRVNVWREKRALVPGGAAGAALFGAVEIALGNVRRGEPAEGWFPVLLGGAAANGIQVGELKMRLRVDEEIILPAAAYAPLLSTLSASNYLDTLTELEKKLHVERAHDAVLPLAVANKVLLQDIFAVADREVDGAAHTHATLFRGNSVLTKTMEHAMLWYGRAFLERSVGPVVRRMCAERVAIEVDPVRLGLARAGGVRDLDANVRLLVHWCAAFWEQIYHVRGDCPNELRKLFQHVRGLVERRYAQEFPELKWQCVSAFCFLRFIVPAILHPHLFGLCQGLPPVPVQRSLTLVAKVIQSLANLNASVQKEEFMRGVKDFVTSNLSAMIDYIVIVSNPVPDQYPAPAPAGTTWDAADRAHVLASLHERLPTLPLLVREGVPLLPDLLDVPRCLAVLTSAVMRSVRVGAAGPAPADAGPRMDDIATKCLAVEGAALQCVSRLAARPALRIAPNASVSSGGKRSAASPRTPRRAPSPASDATPPTSPTVFFARDGDAEHPDARNRLPAPPPRRKPKRPSTAPSSTGTGTGGGSGGEFGARPGDFGARPGDFGAARPDDVGYRARDGTAIGPMPRSAGPTQRSFPRGPSRPPSAPDGSVRPAFGAGRSDPDLRRTGAAGRSDPDLRHAQGPRAMGSEPALRTSPRYSDSPASSANNISSRRGSVPHLADTPTKPRGFFSKLLTRR